MEISPSRPSALFSPSFFSSFTPFLLSSLFLLSLLSPFLLSVLPSYLSFNIYGDLNVCQALDWVLQANCVNKIQSPYWRSPLSEARRQGSPPTRKSAVLALGEQTKMGEPGGPKLAWEVGCQGRLPRGSIRACFENTWQY